MLPEGWPEFGTLRGEPVALDGIETRLSADDLVDVVVEFDGAEVRPWRMNTEANDGTVRADPANPDRLIVSL